MAGPNSNPAKKDRSNENFKKAYINIMGRCDDISNVYNAEIYLLIRRRCLCYERHYEYRSTFDQAWPTPLAEVARTYPMPIKMTPDDFTYRRIHKRVKAKLTNSSSEIVNKDNKDANKVAGGIHRGC
jgi:hypothetical protein